MTLRPFPRAPVALLLLAAATLAGCASPQEPAPEVVGSDGIAFLHRPLGEQQGNEVVWTTKLLNKDNTTSAPAKLVLSIRSSAANRVTERSIDVAAIPPRGQVEAQVRTPYDGFGDYGGAAEIRVGERVVARAMVFFEKCAPQAPC